MNLNLEVLLGSNCSTENRPFSSFRASAVKLGQWAPAGVRRRSRVSRSSKSPGRTCSKGSASNSRSTPAPRQTRSIANTPPTRIMESSATRSLSGSISSARQKLSTEQPA
eukprot:CAMPEP_0175291920 /NCGR_PEP_ID=MMETSP0093-20121207/56659_1 /TAXON_ID=311494 /ORGANISM="Alexandrium monilatum, Strain CCMP3105" /LENGTH=109 /DNA_ID=CAMNT_0016587695 /DNA_START=17 /DNA_END=346 /DNA_ORIENTATION=+